MAIYDTMQYIKSDVFTMCIGMGASMGAFLLEGGKKGKKFALPNAEIMIHQPSEGAQGQATKIQIDTTNILFICGGAFEGINKIMEKIMTDTVPCIRERRVRGKRDCGEAEKLRN